MKFRKIPARHVITHGHTWAEFYVGNNGWIPVGPTFKTFGKVTDGYGLVRSNELLYKIQISDDEFMEKDYSVKNHIFYPSHVPYECDEEVTFKAIRDSD